MRIFSALCALVRFSTLRLARGYRRRRLISAIKLSLQTWTSGRQDPPARITAAMLLTPRAPRPPNPPPRQDQHADLRRSCQCRGSVPLARAELRVYSAATAVVGAAVAPRPTNSREASTAILT